MMIAMTWSVVGPLLGVVIGTLGSLSASYLATRTTRAETRAAQVAALRAERKDAVREFLEVAQLVEHASERRVETGELPEDMVSLTHRLWFKQKCVEIVAGPQLRAATEAYAWRIGVEAAYQDLPDGKNIWDFMSEKRTPFLAAARDELGISDFQADTPRTGPAAG